MESSKLVATLAMAAMAAGFGAGCAEDAGLDDGAEDQAPFSSAEARLLDFTFDGEVVTSSSSSPNSQIRAQLLYTVGHINADGGVAELPKVALSNVTTTSMGGGLNRIRYHAKLPVAWGDRASYPSSYTFTLPRRVGSSSESTFVDDYRAACSDDPASSNANNYWYHYRPNANGCTIDPADVVRATATVAPNPGNTRGKYPEYARVWEDGVLRVLAIFGKFEETATGGDDPGIAAYNEFVGALRTELPGAVMSPRVSGAPGASTPEVTFALARSGGRRIEATVILVDKLSEEGSAFDRRYAELSAGADLILYNGHAGLGANVRSLADKGKFVPGKYQLFLFNGCDSLAYLDETLAQKRAAVNPDDPSGTRYMDILSNAMPAYFDQMSRTSMSLVRAMMATDRPATYEGIFGQVDSKQMIVVTGEEDNGFTPSTAVLPTWGFSKEGAVRKGETVSYETELLPAGSYVVNLMPDPAIAGGDADLRVRVGAAPALTSEFKCPSYVANSNERCALTLASPAKVYVAVTGDSSTMASPFELRAFRTR